MLCLFGCSTGSNFILENYFCDESNCIALLLKQIGSATDTIHCALYNIDEELLQQMKICSSEIDVRIVQDKVKNQSSAFAREVNITGLMHNKFCIFDGEIVTTGSFNPVRASSYDDFIIIKNRAVAEKYEKEFFELWTGSFSRSKNPKIETENISVEVYFCPEDDCAKKLSNELRNAQDEILFMTYSFTSAEIALEVVKAKFRGVKAMGIMDNSQLSEYSKFGFLTNNGVKVIIDPKATLFHFKTFIIDNSTVATGSFNPTQNAQLNNKENLVIIHNEELNKGYRLKFYKIWNQFND